MRTTNLCAQILAKELDVKNVSDMADEDICALCVGFNQQFGKTSAPVSFLMSALHNVRKTLGRSFAGVCVFVCFVCFLLYGEIDKLDDTNNQNRVTVTDVEAKYSKRGCGLNLILRSDESVSKETAGFIRTGMNHVYIVGTERLRAIKCTLTTDGATGADQGGTPKKARQR